MHEAPAHPHNAARDTFVERSGVVQPNAAPRFSRTPTEIRCDAPAAGANTREALNAWGVDGARIDMLFKAGAIK